MLHIGRDKVYQLLRTGQLRSIKIGKLRRITEEQLAEFIASLEGAALRITSSPNNPARGAVEPVVR
jgi:excisionase family DNA binding protein